MVEVFKTNVKDRGQALLLMERIHRHFPGYKATFDLEDCDRILRVKSVVGAIEACRLIDLIKEMGHHAEVLPDVVAAGGFRGGMFL